MIKDHAFSDYKFLSSGHSNFDNVHIVLKHFWKAFVFMSRPSVVSVDSNRVVNKILDRKSWK